MKVDLEHKEWTQVISAIAAVHPLIAKISSQLAQQQPEQVNAAERFREREDTRAKPSREPSPLASSNSGHSPEFRAPRSKPLEAPPED